MTPKPIAIGLLLCDRVIDNDEIAHRRVRVYQAPPGTYL